ncbi:unnamed protein product [Rotaria sp. Silwood2]|nr:unnamed protein product [Rotaria sp. Silwood2]
MLKYILNDQNFVSYVCPYLWFISAFLVIVLEFVVNIKAPYGRYNINNSGIPARLAWFTQELPCVIIPCYLLYYHWSSLSITKFIIFIKQLKTSFDLVCQTFEKNNEAFWLILFTKINYNDFYRDYLLQLAKKDLFGGDLILSGLIDFCFQLLDEYSQSSMLTNESSFSVIELLKTLASKWLSDIVRLHKSIQEDIIHRLFDRILEAKTNDRTVKHFVEQLYDVMKTNSHRFVKWPEQLKDRLDQILLMRYDLAHDVIDAFKPIIKLSGNTPFRETYFQLLRKAMYRPRLDCRRMAVDGYLILLKHAKWLIRPPATQASQMTIFSLVERGATQMNTINSTQRSTEGQCIELLMQLRRSLTQQYDVRLTVYEGLLPVLRKSPILMAPILDMLISQVKKQMLNS